MGNFFGKSFLSRSLNDMLSKLFQSNDTKFMASSPLELIVDANSNGNLLITDVNHKIVFKVKPHNDSTCHDQRILLDADNQPIVLLRQKIGSVHNRWKAYKGDSTDDSDKIFSIKKSKMIQFQTNLHVFLTKKESYTDVCDFNIRGSWSNKDCTIYMGDSSQTIIAQMYKTQSSRDAKSVEDTFMVTIYPNMDSAFVISIIAIIEAMKRSHTVDIDAGEVIGNVAKGIVGVAGVVGTVLQFS